MPTAETYPRESIQNGTNVLQLTWQDFFTDPKLQELIQRALENNRDLRIAIKRMDEVWAIYGLRWADLFPTIDANAPSIRLRVPGDLTPSGQATIFSAYLAAFSFSAWEVDFWGRLRNLKDAALENYLATEEAQHATLISLIGQVANTYLIECELNEQIYIAQKTIETRQESYRIMKRRFEEGWTSKLEVVQVDALLQEAKSDLTTLERRHELNWNAMTLLVGTPVITRDNFLLSQVEPYFTREILTGLPSELLCNRPDVLAAEHRLKATNANIGAARAAFFPMISLTGAYGSLSSELHNLFQSGSKFWTFLPNISVPIFDWGRNKSNLDLAKARKNIAIAEYERTIQVAFREVADALAERFWLEERIVVQDAALAAQSERARLAWLRYQFGASPYLEVLDAERDKFSVQQELVQTRRACLSSRVNLYTSLGGGYLRE